MSFFKRISTNRITNRRSFIKTKPMKVVFLSLGVAAVVLVSFFAYLYITGSRMFDSNTLADSPLLKAIRGDSNGAGGDRVNFLLMGRGGDNHPGGLLTDSIMLVSINSKTKSVATLSIPRDLYTPIKGHGEDKVNSAFADGYNDYMAKSCAKKQKDSCRDEALSAGANLEKQTVSDIVGLPIHYYVMMDFVGFKQLVDGVGGIDLVVDKNIYDPLYPDDRMEGYSPFYIKAGNQHMSGEIALKYSRSRETTSDFDRSRRQTQVISAIKDKALKAGFLSNPVKLIDMVNIIGNHVRTDLSPTEIKALATFLKDVNSTNIKTKVLSSDTNGLYSDSSTGTYYLRSKDSNFSEIKKIAAGLLDADSKTAATEKIKVEILNGSSTAGYGGKLSETLKGEGFDIINVQSAKEKSKTTLITNYSLDDNNEYLKILKKGLGAEVVKPTSKAKANIDISILIGDDYQGFSKK